MCVLSGMNSLSMVKENCAAAADADAGSLTAEDHQLLSDVVSIISSKTKVDCTGCRYCMPCPANVDIPGTFAAYNDRYTDGFITAEKEYMMCTTLRKDITAASNCVGCGKCEQHCPQAIAIRNELKNARKVLEGPVYKIGKKIAPLIYKY
jgi:predicted aldo/keto reductase-like oxidoreductase